MWTSILPLKLWFWKLFNFQNYSVMKLKYYFPRISYPTRLRRFSSSKNLWKCASTPNSPVHCQCKLNSSEMSIWSSSYEACAPYWITCMQFLALVSDSGFLPEQILEDSGYGSSKCGSCHSGTRLSF